jgi:hypothetical protein
MDAARMPDLMTLSWQRFEALCESLVRAMNPEATVHALTLGGGHGSDGVDFVVVQPSGDSEAFQAKRARSVTKAKITEWVRGFPERPVEGKVPDVYHPFCGTPLPARISRCGRRNP